MPTDVTNAFKGWLKVGISIKLRSDAAVLRLNHEGITTYKSVKDFDKKLIEQLLTTDKVKIPAITEDQPVGINAEAEIAG